MLFSAGVVLDPSRHWLSNLGDNMGISCWYFFSGMVEGASMFFFLPRHALGRLCGETLEWTAQEGRLDAMPSYRGVNKSSFLLQGDKNSIVLLR